MIIVEESKIKLKTLRYNGKYIHSRYNPLKEAEKFIEGKYELLDNDVVVVYGLGLGYHIDAILNKIKENTKVYVFEWNTEVIDLCRKYNFKLFTEKNVEIISGDINEFYSQLSEKIKYVEDIIIHTASLELIKESNEKLYFLLRGYLLNKMTIKNNSEMLEDNLKANMEKKYDSLIEVITKLRSIKKRFLVTASGPSLDSELDLLKNNREKFTVISVGSSLRTLMKNDIKPDIIVIIDGQEIVKEQLRDYEDLDIPLCFLATASRAAVECYKGPKYIFFNNNSKDNINITTGRTVAVASIDIAIQSNAKEIILLGQDLAFIGEKSHTSSFEDTYNDKDDIITKSKRRKVIGIDGSILETTEGFLYFKHEIEKLIMKNNKIKFINCSKGAAIEGTEYLTFEEYIKRI